MVSSNFPQALRTTNYNNAEKDNMVEGGRVTMLKELGSLSDDMEQNCPTNWTLEVTTWERNRLLSFKTLYLWGLLGQLDSIHFLFIWEYFLGLNVVVFSPSQAKLKSKREDSSCC